MIVLSPTADGTEIQVKASAEVGGLIARVGQRLIDGVAQMTMDRFFSCLPPEDRAHPESRNDAGFDDPDHCALKPYCIRPHTCRFLRQLRS